MIPAMKVGNELRRFSRSTMGKLTLISITLMPLLYSTLYLWSFWNPFGNLSGLPVALVNSDRGAVMNGQEVNAGAQVADGILANDAMDWHLVSKQDAVEGVRTGEYYFSVELPENFSQAVTSAAGDKPEQAKLMATYNDRNGYLSSIIGENAMRVVLQTVGDKIGAQAVDRLLVGMLNAGMGISMAADGAGRVSDGADQLHDGLVQLDDGAGQLRDGLVRNKEGTTQLVDGAKQLRDGSAQLAAGTSELRSGVNEGAAKLEGLQGQIASFSGQLDDAGATAASANQSLSAARDAANAAATTQSQSATDVKNLADQLRPIDTPEVQAVVRQLDQVSQNLTTGGAGPNSRMVTDINNAADTAAMLDRQLNDPNSQLNTGMAALEGSGEQIGRLVDGVARLDDGAHRLADGADRLHAGSIMLNTGATQLLDGSTALKDGTQRAEDGSAQLADGASQLARKLREGSGQVPNWNPEQRQEMATVMGGPVGVNQNNTAGDNTFGAGLAPMFFSMALFVGGLMTYLVIRPLSQRQVAAGSSPIRTALDSFAPGAVIATLQALCVVGFTMAVTPFRPDSVVGVVALAIMVACMFTAINQALNGLLGNGPGRVTSLSLLMVQVVSCGGLYPTETQPQLLQWIHPFMPMKYAVDAFRQVMYGTYDARLWISIGAMILVTALFLGITALAANRDRTWSIARLHPAIDV
ncbi:YhgE/Pip domain-containing protein [Corynebacterium sp.]|uniref:YhgE/Pip domain-containing protein n=1 Tax=Corynebacterium sp. TaxID=1720 RepID=UPI0026DD3485|nr:YhgE/Pip domain-containing protein [Corynebacterium sp.]MDO4610250.1 YhgE/Pip domain-containing protein [Corynebacterium sp.]